MFNRIGRLAIAGAVGVIVGAGIILGITQIGSESYMPHDRSCRVQDGIGDGGDTLEIIVWDAIPTYDLMVYPARIIECETRRK